MLACAAGASGACCPGLDTGTPAPSDASTIQGPSTQTEDIKTLACLQLWSAAPTPACVTDAWALLCDTVVVWQKCCMPHTCLQLHSAMPAPVYAAGAWLGCRPSLVQPLGASAEAWVGCVRPPPQPQTGRCSAGTGGRWSGAAISGMGSGRPWTSQNLWVAAVQVVIDTCSTTVWRGNKQQQTLEANEALLWLLSTT